MAYVPFAALFLLLLRSMLGEGSTFIDCLSWNPRSNAAKARSSALNVHRM